MKLHDGWPSLTVLALVSAVALALTLASGEGFAHGGARGLVMLLPVGFYQVAAVAAVGVSVVVWMWLPAVAAVGRWVHLPAWLPARAPAWPGLLSCAGLWALVAAGWGGATDPLTNPLPVAVWTLWWVGFTLAQCVIGDWWPLLNPWSGVLRLLPARWRRGWRPAPRRLKYAPAVALFLAFAWFELVSSAPSDPPRLAMAVAAYWCFTLAGCCWFGERYWLRYAEPFAVFFRLIGGCAVLERRASGGGVECRASGAGRRARIKARLCLPGAQLVARAPLPWSGVWFVLLTLSSVSFDGLRNTFTWLALIGVNPLAHPGRSAVIGGNSLGLLLAALLLGGVFCACVWFGCRAVGRRDAFAHACGRLVYSLLPISLAFHFAHYLTAFLDGGQYALLAFNDPFAIGWNLLGAERYVVTAAYLTNLDAVRVIWMCQSVGVVLGHIIAVGVAHRIAVALFGGNHRAASSQIGMAALMLWYTWFGLWLLSTPAVG